MRGGGLYINVGRFERFEAFKIHFQRGGGFCLDM
jgi:hypothetical protein